MSEIVDAAALRAGDRILVRTDEVTDLPDEFEAEVRVIVTGPHGGIADCESDDVPGQVFTQTYAPGAKVERISQARRAA